MCTFVECVFGKLYYIDFYYILGSTLTPMWNIKYTNSHNFEIHVIKCSSLQSPDDQSNSTRQMFNPPTVWPFNIIHCIFEWCQPAYSILSGECIYTVHSQPSFCLTIYYHSLWFGTINTLCASLQYAVKASTQYCWRWQDMEVPDPSQGIQDQISTRPFQGDHASPDTDQGPIS